jgi:hypothetical protein
MRKRRTEPDPLAQPERRYVQADRSQRGQTRYVQPRNGWPKIRIKATFGTKGFDDKVALYGDATDHIMENSVDVARHLHRWRPHPANVTADRFN